MKEIDYVFVFAPSDLVWNHSGVEGYNPSMEKPKHVYLDQNMWIGLARCFYGFEDSAGHKRLLDMLQHLVKAKQILLPLSVVHLIETAAPENRDRRERLARFMLSLSGGMSILPLTSVRRLEVLQAIGRRFGCKLTTNIRDAVVRDGIAIALGCELTIEAASEEVKAQIKNLINSEEMKVKMLVDAIDRGAVQVLRDDDEKDAALTEDMRRRAEKELGPDQRRRIELAGMAERLAPVIRECLNDLCMPLDVFSKTFNAPDDWISFLHDIPTIDVFVTLGLARDAEEARLVHRNDLKDIGFLSMAVPYCDVVVCERFFHHLVCKTGLDGKYKTMALRSLDELQNWAQTLI